MSLTCLNCGETFDGKFCPQCGQKANVGRLKFSVLTGEVLHFFTHLEHGFLFTTIRFLLKPGLSSLEYVEGKRKKYQKPVSYFLIWTGLYILVHNAIINLHHFTLTDKLLSQLDFQEQANLFFRQHFTIFLIPVIFLSALILFLVLARPRFNYIEVLTLSLYGAGTYFMMSLVTDFLLGFVLQSNILAAKVFLWQAILSSSYNFWFSYDLFKRIPMRHFWLRLILTSVLVACGGWIIMFYLPMVWIRWME